MLQDLRRCKEVRLRSSSKLGGAELKGRLLVAFVGGYRLVEMIQLLTPSTSPKTENAHGDVGRGEYGSRGEGKVERFYL